MMERKLSLILAGDTMLGRAVNATVHREGPAYPWGNMRPLLQSADWAIVNLECVIATTGQPWSPEWKAFHFRADPIAIDSLRQAGIDCVSIANNHVMDYGYEALAEMLARLDVAGIHHAGADQNIRQARSPALLRSPDMTIAVIAATDDEPQWLATDTRPGTNWLPPLSTERALQPIREDIQGCRAAGADLVIFSMHAGPSMRERPSVRICEFAHAVIDAGADVYFGHSAHVFQGIEIYHERPILHDAGDFVDDYAIDPHLRNDQGLLFRLQVAPSGVERIELIPLTIGHCQVNVAEGAERRTIGERIQKLSAEFGTEIVWHGSTLEIKGVAREEKIGVVSGG
jgi:poly-gamma-glutamate synthesis protein (capsule biosynthesis protein)